MVSNRSTKLRMISPLIILFAVALMPLAGIGDLSVQAAKPLQSQEAPRLPPLEQPLPPGTGFKPPEMDLSHLTGQEMPEEFLAQAQAEALPTSWDWRTQGKVTSVKDQGACGACYAFGSIGNIESKMLIDGAGSYDFSENNAKECNWRELNNYENPPGKPWGSCDGGNYLMLANLFSQKGVVLESCDPYVPADVDCNGACPYQITLLDWRLICGDVVPDTDVLKSYIQTYGPVSVTMYVDLSQGFDESYDGSYTFNYFTSPALGTTHAVLIVGWSNNLPPVPGGMGPADGWIVKNSRGPDWGDNGYFYMTYGAANIGMRSSFINDWQYYDNSGGIMYYDDDGWLSGWGWSHDTTAWGLAKFFPASDTNVTRVEFWTTDKTTDVDVYIYGGFDGTATSNLLWSSLNNSFNEAGYHGVTVNPPLAVNSGDDVIAVVKFTNDSYGYPIPVDDNAPYVTGLTYMSHTGASGTWSEMGAGHHADVAIRLRTSAGNNPPNAPSSPSPAIHATGVSINADMSWTGGDPDAGDTVTYDVYFGTSSTPPLVSDNQAGTSYEPEALAYNTKYYWNIVATDNHGASTTGPLWDFTTVVPSPSDITVSPTSFNITLAPNTTQSYTLIIGNDGGADLSYDISDRETAGGSSQGGRTGMSTGPAIMVLETPLKGSPVESESTGEAQSGWQNIMTDGFESTFPGNWGVGVSSGHTNAYWGKDNYRPHSGSYGAFCAKSGTAGVNPPADYRNNMDAWMIYGPFSLADATDAELNFYCWLKAESNFDYLHWYASIDGSIFYGWWYTGDSGGWVIKSFDLTDVNTLGNLCGQPQVWIAFVFDSDEAVTNKGAFVDDVVLHKYVSAVNNSPNVPSNPSPANHATGVSVNADLSWTGGDPDAGDTVTYDVYFGTSATPPLVSNDQTGTTHDPGTLTYNTKYYWQIVATDNHAAATAGPVWDFTTGSAPNNPPNVPSNPSPANHATGVSINANLSWTGGDPDAGDTVTYDVYFGTSSSPPLASNGQSGNAYDPGTLGYNTKYYWRVVATDNHGAPTIGPLCDFTTTIAGDCPWLDETPKSGLVPAGGINNITVTINTTGLTVGNTYTADIVIANTDPDENPKVVPVTLHVVPVNNPPNVPGNPSPSNHASGSSVNASLSWMGGDPDVADTVTYDVYFGTSTTPPLVSTNQTGTTYDPGTLAGEMLYYWQIVARDNHGAESIGPVWWFSTGELLLGDANMDGVVDTGDITKVKRIYFGLDNPTPCADVNGDGFIDTGDITAIKIIYFS
jgi:C1A family cysteine protease